MKFNRPPARKAIDKFQNKRIRRLEREMKKRERDFVMSEQVTAGGDSITQSFQVDFLSGVAQGDDEHTRDGAMIAPTSLLIRYNVTGGAASGSCRIIIFKDNATNGTQPTQLEFIENAAADANNYLRPAPSHIFKNRFLILYSRMHSFNQNGNKEHNRKIYLKLKGKTSFIGASAATTSAGQGHYYIAYCSELVQTDKFSYVSKFSYTDS